MDMCYLDTETCGLHGMPVIIQYAFNDDPTIHIHEFWTQPIYKTLELIERIADCCVVGFNLAFDWFHIQKIYNTFKSHSDPHAYPEMFVDILALREKDARFGECIKPKAAFDVMLHARKTKYQVTMARSDIKIRRVPTPISGRLAKELETRVELSDILFARRTDKTAPKWTVRDIKTPKGTIDPDFKHVVLSFKASSALKNLAVDALNVPRSEIILYGSIEVPKCYRPVEYGWAPFALAVGQPGKWNGAWPEVIMQHIAHWQLHDEARKYASNDVDYTRRLYKHFGSPPVDDDDSVLACMVASVRWKGYAIDIDGIKELKRLAKIKMKKYPMDPKRVKLYLSEVLGEDEQVALTSTKKVLLEELSNWKDHPVAERARNVLEARGAKKEIELYDKLLIAGRFHASFRVIGTLSSRMSGTDGLNPQGIKKTKIVRQKFPLADPGYVLEIGDFSAFEIVLADAAYDDPDLRAELLTKRVCHKCRGENSNCRECKGTGLVETKIHALFGVHVYTDMTYEEILESSGTNDDKYTRSKSAVFAMLYGGEGYTLQSRLGVDIETADAAYQRFISTYKQVGVARKKIYDSFCSMRQTGGIGTKITWKDPAEYIESLLGFRRYFTLENQICKALFNLAQKPPENWKEITIKVVRRERIQTAQGATQSALFGSAFQIQAAAMRAAANHVIQSSGAQITKYVQRKIWDIQPSGPYKWLVQPANIHDEIFTPTDPEFVSKVKETVSKSVEHFRPKVPLIGMDWVTGKSWADK